VQNNFFAHLKSIKIKYKIAHFIIIAIKTILGYICTIFFNMTVKFKFWKQNGKFKIVYNLFCYGKCMNDYIFMTNLKIKYKVPHK